jgi:hypothetical protein
LAALLHAKQNKSGKVKLYYEMKMNMNMKHYISLLLLLASAGIYSQGINNCGLDNNPALTDEEAAFLNDYFSREDKSGFDFKNKKILIVGGSAGSRLEGKTNYFKSIKERMEQSALPIATQPYPFNEDEKIASGGYDAIVTFWVKVPITTGKIKRIIRRVATGMWEVPA